MDPLLENLSYEQALTELEKVLRTLEDGQTGLEEALAQYEKGVTLIKRCYQQLNEAEQRIRMLCGEDERGQPILQQFAHASAMDAENADSARRGNRINSSG